MYVAIMSMYGMSLANKEAEKSSYENCNLGWILDV